MSVEKLLAASQRLNVSVEALAALGADLRMRTEGLAGDPAVRALLAEVAQGIDPAAVDGTPLEGQVAVLGFIRAFFRQALDLLDNPSRPPGWAYEDPVILQVQGQASRLVVRAIEALAARRPALRRALDAPGRLLDVGSGVGWLAIEAARSWPGFEVVGIDPWEPALALAERNLAEAGVADRVMFRRQSLDALDESGRYSIVWLAAPFIPKAIVESSMPRLRKALAPGGTLVFGLFNAPPLPLAEPLMRLRIVRNGGYPWTADEAAALVRGIGLADVESFSPGAPIFMVAGTSPD